MSEVVSELPFRNFDAVGGDFDGDGREEGRFEMVLCE